MILGIDVGSQSLKAVLLDDKLRTVGSGRRGYAIDFPQPGWAEQSPAVWEQALGPAIAEALAAAGRKPARCDGHRRSPASSMAASQSMAPAPRWPPA